MVRLLSPSVVLVPLLAFAQPHAASAGADDDSPDTHWTVWLGDRPVGRATAARPGLHRGAPVSIGGMTYRAEWMAGDRFADTWQPRLVPADHATPADPPPPRQELIILTTAELAGASELLPRFMDFRAAEGWDVRLVTDAQWDVPSGSNEDEPADRIRAFLADEYAAAPGAYLLLIGDPDPDAGDVPMKWVRPLIDVVQWYPDWLAEEMDPIPTDFYFADLDGDWDCDGDGRYGEYPDDDGPGCVDFGPELFVGRLPVYGGDGTQLDRLLGRALARDMESDKTYRHDVLLPAALFGLAGAPAPGGDVYPEHDDGACIAHTVHRDLPSAFQEGATRLFEDGGVLQSPYPHEGPLDRDEVVERWAEGRGIVLWCGHGSPTGVYRTVWSADHDGDGLAGDDECAYPAFLQSPDAAALEDVPGAFTWHVSCDNGFPEHTDNIGTALLNGGAAVTATASRPAFGVTVAFGEVWEPRPDLATSSTAGYFYALELADGATAGEAMAYTKVALPGDGWAEETEGYDLTSAAWTTRVEYNLYGDPTRSLELCAVDEDCDDGSPCNGTESCDDGFCVHSGLVDCSHLDDACGVGRCEPTSGECVTGARPDGWSCDDGQWCTEFDQCVAGTCGGAPRDCGSRDGYLFSCVEETDSCGFEKIVDDELDGTPACRCTAPAGDGTGPGTPRGALAATLLTLAGAIRRRRGGHRGYSKRRDR